MHMTQIQSVLNEKNHVFYTEEDNCGSIDFEPRSCGIISGNCRRCGPVGVETNLRYAGAMRKSKAITIRFSQNLFKERILSDFISFWEKMCIL